MTNISTCGASSCPVNATIHYLLHSYIVTTAFGINMVFGLPMNCYIMWLSVKEVIQGQSTKILFFNWILIEIIFCFTLCFVIARYFFDCIICRLPLLFFAQLLLFGRPLFLSLICVECYLGVLHPLIFLKLKPMKYRIIISAVGWIAIISACVIGTIRDIYNTLLPVLLFFFLVKLYSCLMVLKALLRPSPGDDDKKRNGVNQDKKKAFRVMLIMVICATLTYGPIFVSLVLYHILDLEKFQLSWAISFSFGVLLGVLYPFLHLRRIGKLPFCNVMGN